MEVKRIPPCPDYDIRGTEQWLEDMAKKGFRLCEGHAFQYGFAYFQTGEPTQTRYRITPAKKVPQRIISPNSYPEQPDEETLQFHAEFGWRYVTYRGQFWIFACDDPTAPEMNTDPQIQAIALKTAEKRLREHFFGLLMYGLIWIISRSDGLFCSTLVREGLSHYWPLPVFFLLVCAAWLPGVIHITRFRRILKQGHFPEKTTYPSALKAHTQFLLRFLPFLWIIVSLWIVGQATPLYGDRLTPETAAALPYVTVSDLFPEAEVRYISHGSSIYTWQTDMATSCTEVSEHFRLTLPDGSTTTGFLELCRYETAFDWIAAGCARETRFIEWLRGDTTLFPLALEGTDWVKAYRIERPRWYKQPHNVILIQKDNVFFRFTLHLYDPFPTGYTLEELGQILLTNEQ